MGGRAAINIPSNQRENVIFMDHQKMEPPNSTVPKDAATKWPIQVLHAAHSTRGRRRGGTWLGQCSKSCGNNTCCLTRALLSQGGGGGGAFLQVTGAWARHCAVDWGQMFEALCVMPYTALEPWPGSCHPAASHLPATDPFNVLLCRLRHCEQYPGPMVHNRRCQCSTTSDPSGTMQIGICPPNANLPIGGGVMK